MKEIPLTRGKSAIVDDGDYDHVMNSNYKWYAMKKDEVYYAYGVNKSDDSRILMHRLILNFPPRGIDHIDRNGLNNSRSNLREASQTQNLGNSKIHKNNKCGFKGVYYEVESGKYRARICFNHQGHCLGRYDNPEEAAKAYNNAAQKYFGEFARLNIL